MLRILKVAFTLICILIYFPPSNCSPNRDIKFTENPNCTSECDKPWIIYGEGGNGNNTLHYLWGAVQLPTFVIATSVPESKLEIDNWNDVIAGIPGSVAFSIPPENVFGISFQNLILFNDVNDTGTLDDIPEKYKKTASLSDFEWSMNQFENVSSHEFVVSFKTITFRNEVLENDTKISISVIAYGIDGRSSSLPHLITTSESAQIQVTLDNLRLDLNTTFFDDDLEQSKSSVDPISGFESPRWALEMIIVSSDSADTDQNVFVYEKNKSLDDEHTPGVFDLNSITTPGARRVSSTSDGGYLQWRPVCYLTSDEDINYSTYPNFNTSLPPADDDHIIQAKHSLIYVLFGNNVNNLATAQTPIAFGLTGDGFYTTYDYTIWTFSMGVGAVPEESFSTMIIIVICVGVGLPFALFIVGGVYLGVKKLGRRKRELLIDQ